MSTSVMEKAKIVSQEEWLAAREDGRLKATDRSRFDSVEPCNRSGRNIDMTTLFFCFAKPVIVAQQAADAHDQHVAYSGKRHGNEFGQNGLAGGFDDQFRVLDQLSGRDYGRVTGKGVRKSLGLFSVSIR